MLLDTLLYLYDVECMSPCVLFSLPFSVTPNGFRKMYGMLEWLELDIKCYVHTC
jgi:hypothetical protein